VKTFSRLGASAAMAAATLAALVIVGPSAGHGTDHTWQQNDVRSTSASHGRDDDSQENDARSSKAILFASDGMRQDLMERYASRGLMPTFRDLLKRGVAGKNGLLQAFPPNTGVGWHTLATGAWPSEHGSTNNTFHRTGDSFTNRTSFATNGILQADTVAQAAERAGKTVVSVEWVGARNYRPTLQGPVVDFRSFFGARGIMLNFDLPGQPALANSFGVAYQRVGTAGTTGIASLADATGWSNVPASFSTAKQAQFTHNTSSVANDDWDVYIFDSTNDGRVNYDRALIVNNANGKDGSDAVATLRQGQWADVKVTLTSGLTAGFYVKAIDIAPDLSKFRLYFTSFQRANATYNALGPAGSAAFEETLNRDFPTSTAADFAPLEALIVDEDTYVQQGLMWKDSHFAYLRYIFETLDVKPDLLQLGNPVTDEFGHQFLALLTPTDIDGRPNPYFDNLDGTGARDGRLAIREGYIRAAYREANDTLELGRTLMGKKETTVFASSDHGFAPQWRAINARKVLFDKTITPAPTTGNPNPTPVSLHASGATATSNCGAAATDLAKACWAGGTTQIYVNPTLPAGVTYEQVRTAAREAFQALRDNSTTDPHAVPDRQVMLRIMNKEELRNVDGTDALHPNRSGDVVVVSRPPYQFDAATGGVPIAFSQFFGQHGYTPDLVNLKRNVNLHGTFVAAGPGIRRGAGDGDDDDDDDDDGRGVSGVRAIDVAPTLAFVLGIPGPQNAAGKILYNIVEHTGDTRELTILDISDYHGQLTPLTEAADFVLDANGFPTATALGPSFAIGGSAFLKPWFQAYRAQAKDGSILVAAGDSIGATPPISSFFGDRPTIEMMNAMGFDADGIGNHNFDVSEAYFRNTIVPLARFPYLSANVVDAAGRTPAEWSPSKVFRFRRGLELGLIGFSNEDIPLLTRPGALGPFHLENATAAVNAEAAKFLDRKGRRKVDLIVAMGHLGATAGTLNNPTGPVVNLADNVANVDAVIGDHTDFQVVSHRPNGVLLVENRSKGIRFTRVRLVVDMSEHRVVYKTADFHKPWNIGVTPDAAIQARLNELNAQLSPILGDEVGEAGVQIPRKDACNRADGRLCESRVGDVTTDSMRTTYLTDFAITNSGGLRADLTCPSPDISGDFCGAFTPPPWPITRGQVLAVLPFQNVVTTLSVNGAELKMMLENGVSQMPGANGRFPQVSGFCFTYDVENAAGSRVTSAVRQAADGSCTGTPVDLTAGSPPYAIASNDFITAGGDGYPDFRARATTRDIMDEVLADYVDLQTPPGLSPVVQAPPNGRINCHDDNPGVGNDCPAFVGYSA
jgi:2',3'-cyclic-nucleotide 2'-phosphodiesterase (5'-nucleotidase family)